MATRVWMIFLICIGLTVLITPAIIGWNFYVMSVEQRVRLPKEKQGLRSAGEIGHGYGIAGSILMLMNFLYLFRKRLGRRAEWAGSMRAWMHFHVFVGLTGPILIFYHTAFVLRNVFAKVSLWALLIVVVTGIIGRFVYATIPRDIRGYEKDKSGITEELATASAALASDSQLDLDEFLGQWLPQPQLEGRNAVVLTFFLFWDRFSSIWRGFQCRKMLREHYSMDKATAKRVAQQWLTQRRLIFLVEVLERHRKAFSSWRALHRTLTYVMLLTAVVHVFIATVGFGLL